MGFGFGQMSYSKGGIEPIGRNIDRKNGMEIVRRDVGYKKKFGLKNACRHRKDRVLGFFCSRPNWDPPPLTRRRVCPPL